MAELPKPRQSASDRRGSPAGNASFFMRDGVPFVRVVVGADKGTEYVGKATDAHRAKYAPAWAAFEQQRVKGG